MFNFDDADRLFQTALYFYSSFIQADAAILGFGAVFLIFKIQSWDNLKQNIIQSYHARGSDQIKNIDAMIFPATQNVAHILYFCGDNDKNNYLHVFLIPKNIEKVIDSIKLPVILTAVHIVTCGVLLLTSQLMIKNVTANLICFAITMLWFAFIIILSSHIAITLPGRKLDLNLKTMAPDVDDGMEKINNDLIVAAHSKH